MESLTPLILLLLPYPELQKVFIEMLFLSAVPVFLLLAYEFRSSSLASALPPGLLILKTMVLIDLLSLAF